MGVVRWFGVFVGCGVCVVLGVVFCLFDFCVVCLGCR